MATLMLLAVGCNKGEDVAPTTPDQIRVEAQLPASRATLTSFEAGDVMGLYAVEQIDGVAQPLQIVGNFINNEELTFDGAKWNPTRTLYWSQNPCDFYGIYPLQDMLTVENQRFDLEVDQSTVKSEAGLGGYEFNDLMWAKTEGVEQSDGVVKLQFRHMMSRLVVRIERGPKYEGELPDDIAAHIYNTATTALVDWQNGSVEKYLYSENNTITMRKVANDCFDAIVVPQFIERSTPLVEITLGGIAYLLEYSISFRPGYQHTITVTLNTSPDQEKIEISVDGSVDNWN